MKTIDTFMKPIVEAIEQSENMYPDNRQRFLIDALRLLAQEVNQHRTAAIICPEEDSDKLNQCTKIPDLLIDNYGRVFPILSWEPRLAMDEPATATITTHIQIPPAPLPDDPAPQYSDNSEHAQTRKQLSAEINRAQALLEAYRHAKTGSMAAAMIRARLEAAIEAQDDDQLPAMRRAIQSLQGCE